VARAERGVKDDVASQERYGDRSDQYFWNTASDDIVMSVLTPELRARARAPRPLRVLDVGCGPGNTLRRLQPWGHTFGAEYSEIGLAVARRRGLPRLVAADSLRLPFGAETMDCVLALDVIEHVADDAAALREAYRVLRPGGVLLVTVPAFMSLWRSHDELYGHQRRYSKAGLLSAVGAAGFETARVEFSKCLFFFPLLVRARLDRARKSAAPTVGDFFDIPPWLNRMLRWQIVWEHRLRIGRILPVGVTLVWLGRRPAR
jgi:SAM-dependent methyltransferase